MKHKRKSENPEEMAPSPSPDLPTHSMCSCKLTNSSQSPNVFPFRRRKCNPSHLTLFSHLVPPLRDHITVKSLVILICVVSCSGQYVDTGYGRTTSTLNPSTSNQSFPGSGSNTYYSNQQLRDLRDYPDNQDVNWLSPNPFANRDNLGGYSNNSIYQHQSDRNSNEYMNRNRIIQQQFQNPNARLPGYIVDDLKPEHRGETGDPSDPNSRPSSALGDEQYDGFGRNLPVGSGGRGSTSSSFPPSYNSRERGTGFPGSSDWTNQQRGGQYPQPFYNASRSGQMNLGSGYPQGPQGTNYNTNTYGPNLPPTDSQGRSMGSSNWNNIPGYPSVGPSSNVPGTSGVNYYPNGTRMRDRDYNSRDNYPGSNFPPGGNYPGSADNPFHNTGQNPRQNNQNYNPRAYDDTWRNTYPGSSSGSIGGNFDRDRERDRDRYNNRYPIGPVNYPGRVTFNPGDPYVNIWNEQWSTTTYRPTAPGVLGKWRPDLQGQQRPEDINQVPQAVYVTTNYGRIQGFKVKIYDGPWVPLNARPGIANVDKVRSVVSSFMGIPYARAPINEGRFRPPVLFQ